MLAGKVALVTGASRGIGHAIALELARLGADVGLVQRGDARATVAEIEGIGCRAHVVSADLADADESERAVEEVAEALGRLDVLVANAATIHREPALELSLAAWRRTLDLNLTAVFAASRAAARRFLAQGQGAGDAGAARALGSIVHVASVLSFQGGINVCAYAASKGGVAQLTKALANEWAPLGIRVNAVAPGYVANEQTEPLRADPERYAQISERIPLGRWATPDDIARVVGFLVSPAAEYVHGHVLAADGGWLAR